MILVRKRFNDTEYTLKVVDGKLFLCIDGVDIAGPGKYIEDLDEICRQHNLYSKYKDLYRFIHGYLMLSKSCESYRYKPEIIFEVRRGSRSLAIRREHRGYTLILDGVMGPRVDDFVKIITVLNKPSFKPWLRLFLKSYSLVKAKVIQRG